MHREARRALPAVLVAVLVGWAGPAGANPMDITLGRLVEDGSCGAVGGLNCTPDQQAFRDLSRELGFAMSPFLLAPAETLGYSGFYVALESQLTFISNDQQFWVDGTEEMKPHGALFLSQVQVRKGLPGSAEIGTSIGYMAATEQVVMGLDFKIAPFQGFRKGVGGGFPDIALRGSMHHLLGEDELNLTVAGIDASMSWAITIMNQATIAPYFAYHHLWIIADSEIVDSTPGRNFAGECGSIIGGCLNGEDSYNNLDFEREYIHVSRLVLGARFIYEYLTFTLQYAMGIPLNKRDKDSDAAVLHQISFGLGADF